MRLAKLEIYGFKSFMRRTEIIFPQNITGIVGPNGSGKSNISDAVRWVLGEQSARILRGNSMSDVIFNGTEKRRPLNYCEVTLLFDNSDGQLPISYAEVGVTRRIYRGGEGEYLINGSQCRLRDIIDLFRDTGVGKEGYSIIGQGRIDEILSQRGEDRRAVFEEAAGISRFRARKEEAETRLTHTQENLDRVNDLLEEQKSHLGPLKRQAENAKKYLELSGKLKLLDVRLYLMRYEQLSIRESEIDSDCLHAGDLLHQMEEESSKIASARFACEEEGSQLEKSAAEARSAQLEAINRQHSAKEETNIIQAKIENQTNEREHNSQQIDSLNKRLLLLNVTLNRKETDLKEAQELLDKAKSELEQQKLTYEKATETALSLENEAEIVKRKVMDSVNRVQNARAVQTQQETIRQQVLKRQAEIEQQLQGEEKNAALFDEQMTTAAAKLEAEKSRMEEYERQSSQCSEEQTDILSQLEQLLQQRDVLNQRARDSRTKLEMMKQLQENYDGYQSPVRSALSYARKMNISGVQDVLAKLISVPQNLETALDMALGAAMQNIVTDTENEAKRLIEYLRKNSLGRATFLPINAVKAYNLNAAERSVLTMQGCVGVASELISYQPKYQNVIQNLLGRTVIAENLDTGVEIVRKSGHAFRVVTLQGDVLHSGGSMTGGSLKPKMQNLLGRTREIKELSELEVSAKNEAKKMEANIETLIHRRDELKKRSEEFRYKIHQQDIAVVRENEHLKAAQENCQAFTNRISQLKTALEQMAETLSEVEEKLKTAQAAVTEDTESPEALRKHSEELSTRLDYARRMREKAQQENTNALLTEQNAQNELDRCRRDWERLNCEKQETVAEIKEIETKCEELQKNMRQLQLSLTTANSLLEEKSREVRAAAENVQKMEEKTEENRRKLHVILEDGDSNQKEIEAQTGIVHQLDLKLNRVRVQLSQLNDRLKDLYNLDYGGALNEIQKAKVFLPQGEELPALEEKTAEAEADAFREQIRALGNVNIASIEEYAQLNERYTLLSRQRDDIVQAKDDLNRLIGDLLNEMKTLFTSQFALLQEYFSESFTRLFGGGNGEILLADKADPLNCGIDIRVQPPGKKRQLLSLFSGGERTLTAIALLFAMLKLRPTPFCFLDEIEAALDDANIDNFAEYLKDFSRETQFIVVTHRKGTMERCDTLFGVAMEEKGVTSLVSVNLQDYEKKLVQEE